MLLSLCSKEKTKGNKMGKKPLHPGIRLHGMSERQEIRFQAAKLSMFGVLNLPKDLPEGRRVPCVIDVHGWKGDRKGKKKFLLGIEIMTMSWAYFRFDLPGHSFSDGNQQMVTLGLFSQAIQRAITELSKHPSIDSQQIVLVGTSVGGSAAIMAAARDARIKALALWAPRSDYHDTDPGLYYVVDRSNVNSALRRSGLRYNFCSRIKKFHGPLLIIHGENDQFIDPNQSRKLHQSARQPKRLEIIKGSNHTFSGKEKRVVSKTAYWLFTESGIA